MTKQNHTKESALEKLLACYGPFYNITNYEEDKLPLVSMCEYYEENEKYVLSRKANLWTTRAEEFIFLFKADNLTAEIVKEWIDYSVEEGMKRANIGPNHMYTYITPIFICDTYDAEAVKAIKKCRIYKSFHFSLHGWMDVHTAFFATQDAKIVSNGSGRTTGKILKKVLFS